MTTWNELERLHGEQLAATTPPDPPVPVNTELNREATPLPVWRPHEHGEL